MDLFFQRKLESVETDDSNCLFESMLKQISNKDCMFGEAGNRYTANHLRLQTVKFGADHYKSFHEEFGETISPHSVGSWCQDMLSPHYECDYPAIAIAREVLQVSKIVLLPSILIFSLQVLTFNQYIYIST